MSSDWLHSFSSISANLGVELPPLLKRLIAAGYTRYAPDWASSWKKICLTSPPAFISCQDFEWLTPEQSRGELDTWLGPAHQDGRRLLPFAQTGAGDCYCVAYDTAETCIALVPHDANEAVLLSKSFDGFAIETLLVAASSLESLLEDFTQQEAASIVTADMTRVGEFMSSTAQNLFASVLSHGVSLRPLVSHTDSRPRDVLSFISQDQLAKKLLQLERPTASPFPVRARWEV